MLRFIHIAPTLALWPPTFQYISCYGLSDKKEQTKHTERRFQYISCYGLSNVVDVNVFTKCNFNTSHVTVYRARTADALHLIIISIHLMLRFIRLTCEVPCITNSISIHLMLRFIGNQTGPGKHCIWISIHLMLRFIVSAVKKVAAKIIFQYISCYGLSMN